MKKSALVGYLLGESMATAIWWILLLAVSKTRHYFLPHDWPEATLLSFAAGDLLLIVGGGAMASVGIVRRAVMTMQWPLLLLWNRHRQGHMRCQIDLTLDNWFTTGLK